MQSYKALLKTVLTDGRPAKSRAGYVVRLSHVFWAHDMQLGFPLLTARKMFTKGIIGELVCFVGFHEPRKHAAVMARRQKHLLVAGADGNVREHVHSAWGQNRDDTGGDILHAANSVNKDNLRCVEALALDSHQIVHKLDFASDRIA